jgi:hypothetical protein
MFEKRKQHSGQTAILTGLMPEMDACHDSQIATRPHKRPVTVRLIPSGDCGSKDGFDEGLVAEAVT